MTALALGPYGTNCYVVHVDGAEESLVVDPGEEPDVVRAAVRESGTRCAAILVTHGHLDHIGAVEPLAQSGTTPVYIAAGEAVYLRTINDHNQTGYGPYRTYEADHLLEGGEILAIAGLTVEAIGVAGHSPDSLAFLVTAPDGDRILLVGDALFAGSVGRTDIPGSSWDVLEASLVALFEHVDHDVPVLPGHGPTTTLGRELRVNPFLDAVRARA